MKKVFGGIQGFYKTGRPALTLAVALAAVLTLSLSARSIAAVTATLDTDQVNIGGTVRLTLENDGKSGGKPDLAPLQQDFDVLGTSTSTNLSFVNGELSKKAQLNLVLSPKRAGRIEIPSLEWNGQRSSPLGLTVSEARAGSRGGSTAAAGSDPVFLTSALDDPQPYVQGASILTVRLHTDQALSNASLELAAVDDVLVQQLGKDEQTTETLDGRRYDVVERKYLLLPQRSGAFSLEGPVLNAQVADRAMGAFGGHPFAGMFNTTRPLRLRGEPITLDVRPRPAEATGRDWLPARSVALEETWHPEDAQVRAGEPLTRHLRLRVEGLTAAALPDLSTLMSLPDRIKAYPDQPRLETGEQQDKLVASRDQDIALIATKPGRYILPALRLSWWDTVAEVQREVELPTRTLEVLPAAGAANDAVALPDSAPAITMPHAGEIASSAPEANDIQRETAPLPWPWISLALGLLWVATLAAWWLRRPASKPVERSSSHADGANQTRASASLKAFRQACKKNEAPSARLHLLAWARDIWPGRPPTGLDALARKFEDPALSALLLKLDRACYAGGDWQGEALSRAFTAAPMTNQKSQAPSALADLYP
ncbi:MAG: BatD family protein [Panacagrimonas sp.]